MNPRPVFLILFSIVIIAFMITELFSPEVSFIKKCAAALLLGFVSYSLTSFVCHYFGEKRLWNKGKCYHCGKNWICFHENERSKLYKCKCGEYIAITGDADKDYGKVT